MSQKLVIDPVTRVEGHGKVTVHLDENNKYEFVEDLLNSTIKVETHNHPTAISPYPGAATGSGGEIRDEGATGKAGITGFCWGGRITWLYAAHSDAIAAGVAWYGRLVGQASELQPVHPVDVAARLRAPVLGLYAGEDAGIPQDSVAAMRSALQAEGVSAAAKGSSITVYPQAKHGFHADYRAAYRPEDAQPAFFAACAFFRQHGLALQNPA